MKKILVVMAKEPKVGQVKTRLCPPLTLEQASGLYGCFLQDKISAVSQLRRRLKDVSLAVAFDPPSGKEFFQKTVSASFLLIEQRGASLGERLTNLFYDCLGQGFGQAVVTDSDSPNLPLEYLERAFKVMEEADVVVGPSDDGGYYLVGLNQNQPGLFADITWSTGSVLKRTMAQAELLDLKVELLPMWYDVDTPEDLARLQREIACLPIDRRRFAAKTKEYLQDLRDRAL